MVQLKSIGKVDESMNRVIAFEISSQDAASHSKFYADVFGWELGEPNWGYYPAKTGPSEENGIDGGIAHGPEHFPVGVRLQIEVMSIDESISKVIANGGKVIQDVMDFGDFKLAYIIDPMGVHFGLIEHVK
ncbi:VOC family protein [Gorillibacterium massiliense]|uniref:VOC family protein n=1 Tax=Gorillibacterium massiliense TaxID=1280390 RepID=UPI0004B2ECF4|nr:VOC family protein [Gorillibacterium massiliense]